MNRQLKDVGNLAKSVRLLAKSQRITAKSVRLLAKPQRITAKSVRLLAKSQRITAKSVRLLAKPERTTAESVGLLAQSQRTTAKSVRPAPWGDGILAWGDGSGPRGRFGPQGVDGAGLEPPRIAVLGTTPWRKAHERVAALPHEPGCPDALSLRSGRRDRVGGEVDE
jgi:hypothetical protein